VGHEARVPTFNVGRRRPGLVSFIVLALGFSLATKRSPRQSSIAQRVTSCLAHSIAARSSRGSARLAVAEMHIVPDRIGPAIFAKNRVQAGSCVEK
jgi:hypothetical protein